MPGWPEIRVAASRWSQPQLNYPLEPAIGAGRRARQNSRDRNHAAIPNFVFRAAPDNAVGEKSGKPDREMEDVANGKKPEAAAQDRVTDSRDAYDPGHRCSEEQIKAEICGSDGR